MKPWAVRYDLGVFPASWDFLIWLMNVEIDRRAHNGGPLTVRFVPGPKDGFRNDWLARPLDQRRAILNNVMRPALKLIGATESDEENQRSPTYQVWQTVKHARAGVQIPKWKIPEDVAEEARVYLAGRKPVLATLREASYYPERNSNMEAWTQWARESGEDVLFVRDTAKADEPLAGFETCPRASKDFLFRVALMEQAKVNLMVANGPIGYSLFSSTPWLMFRPLTPNLPDYRPGQPDWWERKIRIGVQGQFPWADKMQRVVWADDTLENLKASWPPVYGKLRLPVDKVEIVQPKPKIKVHASGKRRPLNKEWLEIFKDWQTTQEKYGDFQTRLDSFSMWENIDDVVADAQLVVSIIENIPDVDAALKNIRSYTRKMAFFMIALDALRNADTWRSLIEKHFTVIKVEEFTYPEPRIVVIAWAETKVEAHNGWTPVGPSTLEAHWTNIQANVAAVSKRVEKAPAHNRTAILACYGPSMKDYIEIMKREAQSEMADVISVSASHDFIIENGIIPKYHVECDMRPHKADNFRSGGKDGVQYLMGSCVDAKVLEKLKGHDIALWHVSGLYNHRVVNELDPKAWFAGGGRNVGLRAIGLLYEMGYRQFSIYGMDCCCDPEGYEWAGWHAQKKEYKKHETMRYTIEGREFISTPVLAQYAADFITLKRSLPADFRFRIWGDSLLSWVIKCDEEKRKAA